MRSKLFVREIPFANFGYERYMYALTLANNHYFILSFKVFHFPPQHQGLFGPLLHTRGEDTVPAHVDGPTHGGSHLGLCVQVGIGKNTPRVDGKITILSIISLLDGQLMKNLVLLVRLCTMVIEWRE